MMPKQRLAPAPDRNEQAHLPVPVEKLSNFSDKIMI